MPSCSKQSWATKFVLWGWFKGLEWRRLRVIILFWQGNEIMFQSYVLSTKPSILLSKLSAAKFRQILGLTYQPVGIEGRQIIQSNSKIPDLLWFTRNQTVAITIKKNLSCIIHQNWQPSTKFSKPTKNGKMNVCEGSTWHHEVTAFLIHSKKSPKQRNVCYISR